MSSDSPSLKRGIGPIGLLFTAIGAIIGSGWLFAGLYAASVAGPAAVLCWPIAAVILAIVAMPFAELGAALQVPGGCTRYADAAFGGTASFIAGWLLWLGYLVIPTVETIALVEYLGDLLPWMVQIHDGNRSLTVAGALVAAVSLLTMSVVNLLGVKWLNHSNNVITCWKLVVPASTAALLIWYGFKSSNFTIHGFAPDGIDGMLAGLGTGGVVYCLLGYRVVVDLAGEVRRPQRDVPIAIFGALGTCAVVFTFVQIAFIGAVPEDELRNGWDQITSFGKSGPFAAFAITLGLGWLATVLYVDATVSPYGCGLVFTGANARLVLAMGRSELIPRVLERLSKLGIPWVAVVLNLVLGMLLLAPLPGWDELTSIVAGVTMITSGIGAIAFIRLRRTHPDLPRPFRVPCATPVAIAAFVGCTMVSYWCGWAVLRTTIVTLLIGLVLFALFRPRPYVDRPERSLQPRNAIWIVIWILGIAVLTYVGGVKGGAGYLPSLWGQVLAVAWALVIYPIAVRTGLDGESTDDVLASIKVESDEAQE